MCNSRGPGVLQCDPVDGWMRGKRVASWWRTVYLRLGKCRRVSGPLSSSRDVESSARRHGWHGMAWVWRCAKRGRHDSCCCCDCLGKRKRGAGNDSSHFRTRLSALWPFILPVWGRLGAGPDISTEGKQQFEGARGMGLGLDLSALEQGDGRTFSRNTAIPHGAFPSETEQLRRQSGILEAWNPGCMQPIQCCRRRLLAPSRPCYPSSRVDGPSKPAQSCKRLFSAI